MYYNEHTVFSVTADVAGAVECPTCAYFTESNSPNPKCLDLEEGHPYMTRCPDDHVCQTMFTFKAELNDNKFVGGFKGSFTYSSRLLRLFAACQKI